MNPSAIMHDITIIGMGAAGQMALLRSVLNHMKTAVFLGDADTSRRSRATWVAEIENMPVFLGQKRPITNASREVVQLVERQAELKALTTLIKEAAVSIKKDGETFVISGEKTTVKSRFVILCTGTMDNQPLIQGKMDPVFPYANRGDILYCIRCDGHKTYGAPCAVLGHTDGAGWIAAMLHERYGLPKIYVLTNGKSFEGEEKIRDLLKRYGIEIIEDEIVEILGNSKDGMQGFQFKNRAIDTTKAFVALGTIVHNELAKSLGVKLNEKDHLVVSEKYETSVPGFYAAGDMVAGKKKQVYTAWDMAVDAVDNVDSKIRKMKREGIY